MPNVMQKAGIHPKVVSERLLASGSPWTPIPTYYLGSRRQQLRGSTPSWRLRGKQGSVGKSEEFENGPEVTIGRTFSVVFSLM